MTKKERAKIIRKVLDEYFPSPAIPLNHTSPFTLLVATVLSAQCTDARVNLVTPALFKLADTPSKMAKLPEVTIYDLIKTCGLAKTKAHAIHQLSQLLIDNFQSQVPCTFEELESLPGVGHKTASVVMTQAFHIPAFPVDTHIHRCAIRWKLSPGKSVTQVEKDLKSLFPKSSWNKLHLQIIYFARAFCQAKKHDPTICPICSVIN